MQAKALVDKEDDNLPEVEAERHWDILGDVKAKGLASPLAVTLPVGGGEGESRYWTKRILTR